MGCNWHWKHSHILEFRLLWRRANARDVSFLVISVFTVEVRPLSTCLTTNRQSKTIFNNSTNKSKNKEYRKDSMNLFVTGIDLCHAATILFVERGYLSPSHELTCTGLSSWGQQKRFWSLGTQYGRHHYQHHCRLSQSLLWLTHLRVPFHNAQSSLMNTTLPTNL